MFFQLYTVNTNTNDDEMSWKMRSRRQSEKNSVVKYTFFLATNEKHSPAGRFSNYYLIILWVIWATRVHQTRWSRKISGKKRSSACSVLCCSLGQACPSCRKAWNCTSAPPEVTKKKHKKTRGMKINRSAMPRVDKQKRQLTTYTSDRHVV